MVRWKQFLVREKHLGKVGSAYFDDQTAKATTAFQNAVGADETGHADAATLSRALDRGLLDDALERSPGTFTGSRTDWSTFASVVIAVVGGIVTAWVAVFTAQSDRAKTLELEKLRLQSSILLQAINTDHDLGRALANLRFFHQRKLLEFTDDQLRDLEDKPDTIPSTASPTREADRPADRIAAAAGARVFVQFAGSLQRDRVREMMRDLAGEWRVEGIELGGQRTGLAAGVNEVRYAAGDKAAAERLAEAVQHTKIVTRKISVGAPTPGITQGNFELWISR